MNTERIMSIALFSIAMIVFIVMNFIVETLPTINKIALVLAPVMALLIGILIMNEVKEQSK